MLFKKKQFMILLVVMIFSVLFVGCQEEKLDREDPAKVSAEDTNLDEEDDAVQLSDWEGTWNNMGAYLDDEELEQAFKDLAEREGVTPEEAKADFLEDGKVNFDGLVIEGDKITLLDGFKDKGGQVIKELEFEYKDSKVVKHGNFDTEWFAFESEDDGEYKNLLMMPVHGEEALTHFHLRYGEDLDEILEDEDWYPILVRPNSTYDQLYEEITE